MKVIQLGDDAAKAAELKAAKLRRMSVPDRARSGPGLHTQMRLYSRKPFKSQEELLMLARGELDPEE